MNAMRNVPVREMLIETLEGLEGCFEKEKGELAYLALTSKPEFVIRDRLAWELHKRLKSDYIVAREWERIDLAILRNQKEPEPEALVQLKAWSLFTFIEDVQPHLEKVEADIDKCQKGCPAYALLLATHINDRVSDACYEGVVKYRNGWEKAFKAYKTAQKVEDEAKESIRKELERRKWVAVGGKISAGEAFEVNVDVLYWLVQKK